MSDAIRRAMDEKQVLRRPERDGRMQAFSEAARQRKVRDALDNPLKAGSETTMRWHLMLVEVETANLALTTRVAQLEEWQNIPDGESPLPEKLARAEARIELLTQAVLEASRRVSGGCQDHLYDEAVRTVLTEGRASISRLQRHFTIGAVRALRLLDAMVTAGVIGPYHEGNRGLLLTLDEWDARREGGE